MKSEALDRGMGTGDEGSQSGVVSGTSQGQTGLGGRASPDSPSQVARDAGFLSMIDFLFWYKLLSLSFNG